MYHRPLTAILLCFAFTVQGGEVLDPSQNLRARRDVGIRNAVIVALDTAIPDARSSEW